DQVFEFHHPALDEALALLRGVVFGVLGEVAMRARFGNRLDDRRALDALQVTKLFLELAVAAPGHPHFVHRFKPFPPKERPSAAPGSDGLEGQSGERKRLGLGSRDFKGWASARRGVFPASHPFRWEQYEGFALDYP